MVYDYSSLRNCFASDRQRSTWSGLKKFIGNSNQVDSPNVLILSLKNASLEKWHVLHLLKSCQNVVFTCKGLYTNEAIYCSVVEVTISIKYIIQALRIGSKQVGNLDKMAHPIIVAL